VGSVAKYEGAGAQLNWFLPAGLVPVVGWAATACEVTLAIRPADRLAAHWVAFVAGILLTAFAVMITVALGPQSPSTTLCRPRRGGVPVGRTDVHDESSNRAGVCQTCECGLISGSVKYDPEPLSRGGRNLLIYCSPQEDVVVDIARNPNLKAKMEFSRKRLPRRRAALFMLRVVSRLVRPEFLVVIEIVAAKA
jgi:hypothetical protein